MINIILFWFRYCKAPKCIDLPTEIKLYILCIWKFRLFYFSKYGEIYEIVFCNFKYTNLKEK